MKLARWIGAVAVAALVVAAIVTADGYQVYVISLVGLTAMVGIGINILLGLTGQISLGHAGFYAIGAYVGAILTTTCTNGASGPPCPSRGSWPASPGCCSPSPPSGCAAPISRWSPSRSAS